MDRPKKHLCLKCGKPLTNTRWLHPKCQEANRNVYVPRSAPTPGGNPAFGDRPSELQIRRQVE